MTAPSGSGSNASGGLPSVLRGFAVLVGATVIGQGLGFVALTIVTRRIGAANLGDYNFALALASYFGLLANTGVGYVALRDVATSHGRLSTVVAEAVTLQGIGAAVGYLCLVVAARWLAPNGEARALVPVVGLTFVVTSLTVDWILLGLGSRLPVAIARAAGQVVYAVLVPVLVTTRGGPLPYAWLNVLGLLITSAAVSVVVYRRRLLRFVKPAFGGLWKRLRESTALGYSLIMIQLYTRADILLLGYLSSPRNVGRYAVANRLPYSIVSLATVWIQAVMPHSAVTLRDSPEQFRAELERLLTAVSVVALGLACGAMVYPARLMSALFGSGFGAAGGTFALLSAAMALVPIEAVLSNVLIAGGRDKLYAGVVTVAAVANIALNIVLIPVLAASGSALATLLTEAGLIGLTLLGARRIVGVPRLDLSRLARGAATVTIMCGVMFALKAWSVWIATLCGCGVFVAGSLLLDVFDPALWRRRDRAA